MRRIFQFLRERIFRMRLKRAIREADTLRRITGKKHFVVRWKNELVVVSKQRLNQTMTIDSGSSLSQSEVHLEVFENVIAADEKLIRNVVNNKLIPFMILKGFPLEGCQFEWDDTVVYTPEHIREVERMLINGGYEIAPKYFQDKYGIEITGKREMMPALKGGDADFFV